MPTQTFWAKEDTTIASVAPTWNYGTNAVLSVTSVALHAMLRFDLTRIPPSAAVTVATLRLVCTNNNDDNGLAQVGANRGLTQWYAGTMDGAVPGATDGSTWDERNGNTGAPLAWGAAGGLAGTDFALASTDAPNISTLGVYTWDILADVQAWVADPAVNFGIWLINLAGAHYKHFDSYQTATYANAPLLTVTFTANTHRLLVPWSI